MHIYLHVVIYIAMCTSIKIDNLKYIVPLTQPNPNPNPKPNPQNLWSYGSGRL